MKPVSGQNSVRNQEGFLLLGVLFMILLILFALSIAAPKMAEEVRRDKETETIHRGLQYARAIRMFYTKYGRYPSTIDDLVKTQDQRFLRKRYLDPFTGKDDWRIIHLGEAKVPAMGLFGQTMQNTNGITPTGASPGTTTSSSGFGSSSSGFGTSSSSSFGSSSFGSSSNSSSPFGSSSTSPTSGTGSSPFSNSGSTTSTTGGTDPSSGSTFGSSSPIGGTVTTGQSSNTFGSPGMTVGGAPIVGVGLLSKKESIKVYKKQTHYNQWEFVFDPNQSALEATTGAGTNINGSTTGTNGTTSNGFGATTGSGFGATSGSGFGTTTGSGFGSSGGFGSSSGSGFGSNSGSGFGNPPSSPTNPTSPVSNSPQ
jgi:type II secretory pathway pseudopilin PulG